MCVAAPAPWAGGRPHRVALPTALFFSNVLVPVGPRLRTHLVEKSSSRRDKPGGDGLPVDCSLVKNLAPRWDEPSGGANFFSRSESRVI